jgi:hypothetical protein
VGINPWSTFFKNLIAMVLLADTENIRHSRGGHNTYQISFSTRHGFRSHQIKDMLFFS